MRAACQTVGRDPGDAGLLRRPGGLLRTDRRRGGRRAAAIGREVDELRTNGLCGSPDEVVAKLATYAGAGADRIYLQILDLADLDHLALIAEEVLPHCASL